MDSGSTTHWQKVAVVVTILIVLVPTLISKAWSLLYPEHHLLYSAFAAQGHGGTGVAVVQIYNQGQVRERDVILKFSEASLAQGIPQAAVSESSTYGTYYGEGRFTPVEAAKDGRFQVHVGELPPESTVQVTLLTKGMKLGESTMDPTWSSANYQVIAQEALGEEAERTPVAASMDFRSEWFRYSPYAFAFVIGLFVVGLGAGMIYDIFFSTPQKQMTLLWQQMDRLQERIDKAKRYE
jgi:hypothetical protein